MINQKSFVKCGIIGWCMEILFTSVTTVKREDLRLMGRTSIWMFPIYGLASCIESIYPYIAGWPRIFRGCLYSVGILTGEFLSGSLLKKLKICPWDYSSAKYNVRGVIRLDYAPLWMVAGLVFERILCGQGTHQPKG